MDGQGPRVEGLSGILVVDKPVGITSMTAVAIVRRRAGGAKTGHAGTLDPLASGVLVMAIGSATKLIDRLMATEKRYLTTIDLTAFTTTDDREGERTEITVKSSPDETTVGNAVRRFVGDTLQAPPAFSAVKIEGRRAYKIARQGQAVVVEPRPVRVHSISVRRYEWPVIDLEIHCDKGFYVRSLARDLGVALGTGGHCSSIRRTAVGPFVIDDATEIEQVPAVLNRGHLISNERALQMVNAQAG